MNPKRLQERRLVCGLSQEKLGTAAGIDEFTARNRVSKYEAGRNSPSFELAREFARVLDVPVCYFYIMEDDFAEAVLRLYRQQQVPVLENPDNIRLKEILLRAKTLEQLSREVVTITAELEDRTRRNKKSG
ncbi:helix-turn-helix transcriptional regulator [Salmonella enterica]|nr:helix-turn-helix transcriptional regulator [Salmonella enterica]